MGRRRGGGGGGEKGENFPHLLFPLRVENSIFGFALSPSLSPFALLFLSFGVSDGTMRYIDSLLTDCSPRITLPARYPRSRSVDA